MLYLGYIDGKNFWAQTHIRLGLGPKTTIKLRKNGKIPAAAATSTVAFMAYGGLLVVPPSIGWMAQHTNLHEAPEFDSGF